MTDDPVTTPDASAAPPAEGDHAISSLREALRTCFLLMKLAMLLLIALFFLRGFFILEEGTAALVRRLGRFREDAEERPLVYQPGRIHFAIPVLDTVLAVDTREQHITLDSEFTPAERIDGRRASAVPERLRAGLDGYSITGDLNVLHSKWELTYRVVDPEAYLTSVQERDVGERNEQTGERLLRSGPEQLLREIFQSAVVAVSAGMTIDDLLYANALGFESRAQRLTQERLDACGCGIQLTKASLKEKKPPADTGQAFIEVQAAVSDRQTAIERAKARGDVLVKEAEGRARQLRDEADVYRKSVERAAASDAQNIRDLLAQYPGDPASLNVYLRQYHQEVLSNALDTARVFVVRPGQTWYITAPPPADYAEEEQR